MGRTAALYSNVLVTEPDHMVTLTPNLFQYAFTTGATAALLGATLISMVAAIARSSYGCVMSGGICGVAFLHYLAIMAIRKKQWMDETEAHEAMLDANAAPKEKEVPPMKRTTDDYMVAVLRHSDWLTTLPLLALKLLALAQTGPGTATTFTGAYISALVGLLAFFTVMISCINLIAFDDWHVKIGKWTGLRITMFLVSLCLMTFLFVIILMTAEEVGASHIVECYFFLLMWLGYPLAYLLLMVKALPYWSVDVLFGPLDVFCKAIFALWVMQKAFYP
jgi:bacteriorhodopsin